VEPLVQACGVEGVLLAGHRLGQVALLELLKADAAVVASARFDALGGQFGDGVLRGAHVLHAGQFLVQREQGLVILGRKVVLAQHKREVGGPHGTDHSVGVPNEHKNRVLVPHLLHSSAA
jgi:hypothetical protein